MPVTAVKSTWSSGNLIFKEEVIGNGAQIHFGVDDDGLDVKWFGATASAYMLWDESADALLIAGNARLDLSSASVAAANTDGGVIKCGTSAAPVTEDTANMKFCAWYFDNGATSGDNRGHYMKLALTGSGTGGGEVLRAYTSVDANMGTAHGAHISLGFAASAGGSECSGLGAAVRGTTHIPNVASWAPTGTVCAGMFELYSDGSNSDPAGLTELAVLRLCNSGDATGAADVDTDAYLFSVQGFTAAADTTKLLSSVSLAELPSGTVGLRVKIGTSVYYIPAVAIAEWN